MIIRRQKTFHSKKNRSSNVKPATPVTGDHWMDHYTTPKSAIGIMKDGSINSKIGLSVFPTSSDILINQDLGKFDKELVEAYKNRKDRAGRPLLDTIITKTSKNSPEHKAAQYIKRGGSESFVRPIVSGGSISAPNKPEEIIQNIDGLHEGNGTVTGISYKKTRNPVMFMVDSKDHVLGIGSDTGELVMQSPKVSTSNKIFLSPSQYTHDTDARKLRKYLRAHKGNFEMTKELHEFLYGKQNKRSNNFLSQQDIIKDIPKTTITKKGIESLDHFVPKTHIVEQKEDLIRKLIPKLRK